MSSSSLETPLGLQINANPPAAPAEPDLIRRERSVLHEILRLVAERAAAEVKVRDTRISNDTKADTEYEKARTALVEKFQKLERDAVSADEKRRRSIVDTAMAGTSQANAEFSSSSRRIAKEFDVVRETAKNDHARERSTAENTCANSLRKAAKDHADETKPINSAAQAADVIRERLTTLATRYAKLGITPDAPDAARENYSRYNDPLAEVLARHSRMEAPLKLVEGLIFPKIVTGLGKIWLYASPILVGVLIAIFVVGADVVPIVAALVVGAAIGGILHMQLIKLSKAQLARDYNPLMQTLANADDLILHCRALADDRLKKANEAADRASRGGVQAGQGEAREDHRRRRGPSRRADPQDQRGVLGPIGRDPDHATARVARSHRRPRPPHGRNPRPIGGQPGQARIAIQGGQGPDPRTPPNLLEHPGRSLARRHPPGFGAA